MTAADPLASNQQTPFGNFPASFLACLREAERVILVANNPAIAAEDVDALHLGPRDVLVSFNTCVQWPLLSTAWTNMFVHGFNEPDKYFFGLPPIPQVQALLKAPQGRSFSVLMGCTGAITPLPDVALFWAPIPLPIMAGYPITRPDGKPFAGPSTGFSTLVAFDWLRGEYGYGFELMTLGFSNEAGNLWRGHAWAYEREWLQGANVRVIALHTRPWWQRLLRRY